MMTVFKPFAAAFAMALACTPALAQGEHLPGSDPEVVPDTNISNKGGSLSDKLNSSNGVIRPEDNVDPGIRKPAPAQGVTPVIPPPGSPGGSQSVNPK